MRPMDHSPKSNSDEGLGPPRRPDGPFPPRAVTLSGIWCYRIVTRRSPRLGAAGLSRSSRKRFAGSRKCFVLLLTIASAFPMAMQKIKKPLRSPDYVFPRLPEGEEVMLEYRKLGREWLHVFNFKGLQDGLEHAQN